jgi:soluble lytic murein transglycosylase-like protein
MAETHNTEITSQKTPGTQSGGPLFDFTIPPLAVIIVSLVMIGIFSMVRVPTTAGTTAQQSQIAPLFTEGVQNWEPKIIAWSEDWNLDPNLVATVMQIESCGDPKARSSAGAMGLFQVMPFHFSENEDPYKPNVNARRGLAYLQRALDAGGNDPQMALAGYNGGITGAKRPESAWPSETVRYVYWGSGIYADALKGKDHSDRLEEWLAAGGKSLCKQAAENLGSLP